MCNSFRQTAADTSLVREEGGIVIGFGRLLRRGSVKGIRQVPNFKFLKNS
jgi:hypothetical protein